MLICYFKTGFGGGAFIFNFVATSYVNPHNLSAEVEADGIYFGPEVAGTVHTITTSVLLSLLSVSFSNADCCTHT
jgi:hypothetical protein